MANTEESVKEFSLPLARFEFAVERVNDPENALFVTAKLLTSEIRQQIEAAAGETFGKDFVIGDFRIERGSTIVAFVLNHAPHVLTTAWHHLSAVDWAKSLGAAARYDALFKSVTLFSSQVKGILRRLLGPPAAPAGVAAPVSVSVSVQINPPIAGYPPMGLIQTDPWILKAVIGYLALSHAALLGLFSWLVVTHIK